MTTEMNLKREKAHELFAQGINKSEIGRRLGVSFSTVQSWIPTNDNAPRLNTELREQAQALVDQGMTRSEVARELDRSRQRISQILGPLSPDDEAKDKRIFIYSTKEKVKRLRAIAKGLGLTNDRGRTPNAGSIQKLVDGIATGALRVTKKTPDE